MEKETFEFQNFVKFFQEGAKYSFSDFIYAPCIMLLGNAGTNLRYCHFDEVHLSELKSFVDVAHENEHRKLWLFGGIGSENISKLIKYIHRKNIQILTQKELVDLPPVMNIEVKGDRFYFSGKDSLKKDYSFLEMHAFLT